MKNIFAIATLLLSSLAAFAQPYPVSVRTTNGTSFGLTMSGTSTAAVVRVTTIQSTTQSNGVAAYNSAGVLVGTNSIFLTNNLTRFELTTQSTGTVLRVMGASATNSFVFNTNGSLAVPGALTVVGSINGGSTLTTSSFIQGSDYFATGGTLGFANSGGTGIRFPSDGIARLGNNADNNFTRLVFGLANTAAVSLGKSGGNFVISDGAGTGTTNSLFVVGSVSATNGFASFSTTAAATIAASGWTNTFGINAGVYVTATAVSWIIKNRADATIYTSPVISATVYVHLQPGWSVSSAAGLAGTALPE